MSVLICGRGNCDNCMCDRLICDGSYYICNSCFEELLEHKKTWIHKCNNASDVLDYIEMFMRSDPDSTIIKPNSEIYELELEFNRLVGIDDN